MNRVLLAAVAALVIPAAAQASSVAPPTVVPLPAGISAADPNTPATDVAFNEFCGPGAAADNACETAVAEFQLGRNGSFTGEVDARGADFGTPRTNLAPGFMSGMAESFRIFYDATLEQLSVSILRDGGITTDVTDASQVSSFRFGDTTGVFLRARSGEGGSTTLSNIVVNGTAVGGLTAGPAGSDQRTYLAIANVHGTGDVEITGDIQFDFLGTSRGGDASFAAQFKFVDNLAPAPIPLPAGAVLLMTGLGALGVARRRRRAAA